jgi:aspartate/tyrosine/aromatic aminotransferase
MNTVKDKIEKNEKSEKSGTQELLRALYKNVKMGSDSIINIMPKVEGSELRQELTAELNRYEEFAKEIGKELYDAGEEPKEENLLTKLGAKMGMAMNTMMDATDSHIAQMMIEGATMGITENVKLLREYENKACSERALTLARETVQFMEDSVERMKNYL